MPKVETGEVLIGRAGTATEILYTLEPSDRPDLAGTVALWFLDCPGQSSAWRHYHLAILHLRPIEGVKPAYISIEGATHEVALCALDPRQNPRPTEFKSWAYLRPINFVGQLRLPSDDEAKLALKVLARAVADGFLWAEPPLSGQSEPWRSQLRQLEAHSAGKHFM